MPSFILRFVIAFGLFILLTLSSLVPARSEEVSMNGIRLQQYGDFPETWKLVTVRYRKDSNEMRFTYANSTAWEAMKKNQLPFPDGSVFAKVGYKSGIDPAFESSVVPSGARRFQFMVKNAKKYSETDGWGYALFQSDGKLFEGDVKIQTVACHACHKIVPERNFVFSERIEKSPLITSVPKTYVLAANERHLSFSEFKPQKNIKLKKLLRSHKIETLFIVSGEMRRNFFGGTLDEITPVLIHQLQSRRPSDAVGFVSEDEAVYKLVSRGKKACPESEWAVDIVATPVAPATGPDIQSSVCYK